MTLTQRLQLLVFSIAVATAALTALALSRSMPAVLTPLERERQLELLRRQAVFFESHVQGLRQDMLAMDHILELEVPREGRTASVPLPVVERERVARLLGAFMEAKANMVQLRIISTLGGGRELLRLERARPFEAVTRVPDRLLQNKGHRRYVYESARLSPQAVYLSKLDLNQEHGRVQEPHLPVLRAATPLHDAAGSAVAVLVANLDMGPVLEALHAIPGLEILDEEGGYLLHPDRSLEFGRDLQTGHNVLNVDPELARRLGDGTRTALRTLTYDDDDNLQIAVVPLDILGQHRGWLIHRSSSFGEHALGTARTTVYSVTAMVAALLSLLALSAARLVSRPLQNLTAAVRHASDERHTFVLPRGLTGEAATLGTTLQALFKSLHQRNAELAWQERSFRQVFEASPTGMLVVDQAGAIVMANRMTYDLFGYAPGTLTDRAVATLVPSAVSASHQFYIQQYFENPKARRMGQNIDLEGQRSDGTRVPLEIGLSPVEWAGKTAALAAVTDIRERLHFTEELRRSNVELEQFAFVSSHDLQEPMRVVSLYCQLLERSQAERLDEVGLSHVRTIRDAAQRMKQLVQDLLAYSRVNARALVPEAFDLTTLAQQVVETLEMRIAETDAVVTVEPLPTVKADRNQLSLVFQNLLINALKFRSKQPPRIRIAGRTESEKVIVELSDNGIGIDPRHADRVFKMFQRLHGEEEYEGSGIGLTIVKRIVERHGGAVWFSSTPGEGTTFSLKLPAG